MKLYVMTDIHLYSKRNWKADPYKWEKTATQLQLRESEEIIREAFDLILKDPDTNTVLITGDLTDNGEITSHEDILAILKEYTEKGLNIFLTTATHDYREINQTKFSKADQYQGFSYGYDENYEYKRFIPTARRSDLAPWYAPYGMKKALSVETESMSYTYDFDEKFRLLAINDDFMSDTKTAQRGLNKELIDWILNETKKAKDEGKTLVTCMHHPLITPSPIYKVIGGRDIIYDSLNVANLFADNGINVILTGHSHVHDIGYHKSENGNLVYDISTGSLIGYPPVMRKIEYRDDGLVDVKTIMLETLSRFDLKGQTLPEYCREGFFGLIENMVGSMSGNMVTFAIYANSISIRPWTVYQFWWLFKGVGLFLNKLTVGKVYKCCKKECGLTKEQIKPIKNEKVVPIILKMIESLYVGNANFSPSSPEYRVIMGTIAILDDLIKTLGINLKKILGYATLEEVIEPLVYNNGIDDYDALINPFKEPQQKTELPKLKSNKGSAIIVSLILIILIGLPIILPVGLIFALGILLRGKFNPYKNNKKVLPPRVVKK